jgi:hypothetical protein
VFFGLVLIWGQSMGFSGLTWILGSEHGILLPGMDFWGQSIGFFPAWRGFRGQSIGFFGPA